MQYSKLIENVWLIATREAIAASWKEILPVHFIIGILKLSEIPPAEIVGMINADKKTIQDLTNELANVKQFFAKENINTTLLRRELRSSLGNGNDVYNGEIMHRSAQSKQLFEKAEQKCEQEGKNAIGLLDVFNIFIQEIKPEVKSKQASQNSLKKSELTIPFEVEFSEYTKSSVSYAIDEQHPALISLMTRIKQQSKGILLLFKEPDFMYWLLYKAGKLSEEKSQIKLLSIIKDRTIAENEALNIIEYFSTVSNSFLILPHIEEAENPQFPVQYLNRFFEKYSQPSKVILPLSIEKLEWLQNQCPKCRLYFSQLVCFEPDFYKVRLIDKV